MMTEDQFAALEEAIAAASWRGLNATKEHLDKARRLLVTEPVKAEPDAPAPSDLDAEVAAVLAALRPHHRTPDTGGVFQSASDLRRACALIERLAGLVKVPVSALRDGPVTAKEAIAAHQRWFRHYGDAPHSMRVALESFLASRRTGPLDLAKTEAQPYKPTDAEVDVAIDTWLGHTRWRRSSDLAEEYRADMRKALIAAHKARGGE